MQLSIVVQAGQRVSRVPTNPSTDSLPRGVSSSSLEAAGRNHSQNLLFVRGFEIWGYRVLDITLPLPPKKESVK